MCNAWNHSVDCMCGWGGEGHLGRRDDGSRSNRVSPLASVWLKYDSYVKPNAKCPKCNSAVFFYQSQNGGRVFFDELGPPWPKHPCTDNSTSRPVSPKVWLPATSATSTGYSWFTTGWSPFIISTITSYSRDLLRISGPFQQKDLVLYIQKRQCVGSADPQDTLSQSLVHIKSRAKDRFRLALLPPALLPIELLGYTSSIDAMSVRVLSHRKGKQHRLREKHRRRKGS